MADDRAPAAWDEALAAFHAGELMEAEQVLQAAIASAEATEGSDSLAHGEAWFQLASLLAAMGDHERAIEAFQTALALDLPSEAGTRERLTYTLSLAESLVQVGQLDAAAEVLREGLNGRAALYGEEHPAYAYGLEPLADITLAQGDAADALSQFDTCLQIFWQAGHPRVAAALAGRAFALAALDANDLLEPVAHLPDELVSDVIDALLARAERHPDATALTVLEATITLAEARCRRRVRDTVVAQSNVARAHGDLARCIDAINRLLPLAQSDGERIDLLQGLGLALSDAGRHADAEQAYVQAVAAADALGDPAFSSRTQRDAGLYLADQARDVEAERLLRAAIDVARATDLLPELGRGLIALGVFLRRRDRLEPARAALAEGTTLLPPDDRDWLTGRSHLIALETGDAGGDPMDQALSEALRTLVSPHVAPDLLDALTVRMTADGPAVSVELTRDADDTELERLNRAIRHAMIQLKAADSG